MPTDFRGRMSPSEKVCLNRERERERARERERRERERERERETNNIRDGKYVHGGKDGSRGERDEKGINW